MPEVIATPSYDITAQATDVANAPILSVQHIEKVFGGKLNLTHALNGVSFDVAPGEFVAIMGPSGSGKTTLLNCISTIDRPSSGRILVGGSDITKMSDRNLSAFRRNQLGFIFQDSNLLDTLTGAENISLALTIKNTPSAEVAARVQEVADTLGVKGSLSKYPNQMSGGQRQRIAAARAIVTDPSLILADEPTGALDSRNATIMLETLEMLNHNMNATIIMVTHDAYAASFSSRTLFLTDGTLFNEIRKNDMYRNDYFSHIMEVVTLLGGEAHHAA